MNSQVWLWAFLKSISLFQLIAIPALILKRNDLADVFWGPAFPLAAFVGLHMGESKSF